MPEVKKRLSDMGAVVTPLPSRQCGDSIPSEMTKWADVIAKNNVKFE